MPSLLRNLRLSHSVNILFPNEQLYVSARARSVTWARATCTLRCQCVWRARPAWGGALVQAGSRAQTWNPLVLLCAGVQKEGSGINAVEATLLTAFMVPKVLGAPQLPLFMMEDDVMVAPDANLRLRAVRGERGGACARETSDTLAIAGLWPRQGVQSDANPSSRT